MLTSECKWKFRGKFFRSKRKASPKDLWALSLNRCTKLNEVLRTVFVLFLKLLPYTMTGFDLTTHNSDSGNDTTRPLRQGVCSAFRPGICLSVDTTCSE
jgi:hypothetical protein